MARITVEDCLDHVANRFELVITGSKRARQIAISGKTPLVPEENDKPTVIALREIAAGLINEDVLSQKESAAQIDNPEADGGADPSRFRNGVVSRRGADCGQRPLFATSNGLHDSGRRVVSSSDRHWKRHPARTLSWLGR